MKKSISAVFGFIFAISPLEAVASKQETLPSAYAYYSSIQQANARNHGDTAKAAAHSRSLARAMGDARFNPARTEVDYLVLKQRKRIMQQFIDALPDTELTVLDIGGRIQPYRRLLDRRPCTYIAIDPQYEGLVDIVAFGEALPIPDASIDLVLCTQVLSYTRSPETFIDEIFRVLKPQGTLILTAPSFFPEHHDEHWRILPGGYETLLSKWTDVEIVPEGHSAAGLFRSLNVCLNNIRSNLVRRTFRRTLIPLINTIGDVAENHHSNGRLLTPNYAVKARKPPIAKA